MKEQWINANSSQPDDWSEVSIRFISDGEPIPNQHIIRRDSYPDVVYGGALQMDGEYYYRMEIPLTEIEWCDSNP